MSTNANKSVNNPMKVITGPDTRWSYANVWEAKSINGGAPKFSVSLIIPKSDTRTLAKIKAAIEAAYHEGEARLKGNGKSVPPLSSIKTPLRCGDTERPDDPSYANSYFINANSATAPGIVDADRNAIITRSEVYSGVYGRARKRLIRIFLLHLFSSSWVYFCAMGPSISVMVPLYRKTRKNANERESRLRHNDERGKTKKDREKEEKKRDSGWLSTGIRTIRNVFEG